RIEAVTEMRTDRLQVVSHDDTLTARFRYADSPGLLAASVIREPVGKRLPVRQLFQHPAFAVVARVEDRAAALLQPGKRSRAAATHEPLARAFELRERRKANEAPRPAAPADRARIGELAAVAVDEAKLERAPRNDLETRGIVARAETGPARREDGVEMNALAIDMAALGE